MMIIMHLSHDNFDGLLRLLLMISIFYLMNYNFRKNKRKMGDKRMDVIVKLPLACQVVKILCFCVL